MTVLLSDARELFVSRGGKRDAPFVRELVYADDTLIIDTDACEIQNMMECISECGAQYGLSYNWSKLEALCVRTAATLKQPDGKCIPTRMQLSTWVA
jgi:hypothetical protein